MNPNVIYSKDPKTPFDIFQKILVEKFPEIYKIVECFGGQSYDIYAKHNKNIKEIINFCRKEGYLWMLLKID